MATSSQFRLILVELQFLEGWKINDFSVILINNRFLFFCSYLDLRSDTTLNRGGVRIGTAEIYNVVDRYLFSNKFAFYHQILASKLFAIHWLWGEQS